MTTTTALIPTPTTSRTTGRIEPDWDEDLEVTPCGDEVRASRYDAHVNACEDCADVALAREAADLAWDLYHR